MAKFNEKLRILLENQGWTQAKLAEILKVSPDAVSSWVRGKNTPYIDTFKELCKIFCVTIQELTDDDLDIPEYIKILYNFFLRITIIMFLLHRCHPPSPPVSFH